MAQMYNFAFMLKTYRDDFDYVKRLIFSYEKHNVDNIPLFLVISNRDFDLFVKEFGDKNKITIILEESIPVEFADVSMNEISAGYINQEIVKLAFWKLNLCKNYLCLDSDAYFIRDFFRTEFMYNEEEPYTVLVEDNDLKANDNYYNAYWTEREKKN